MKDIRPEQLPLARTEQLIVKEVDDEVLVYDLKTDQAHCLNKTAAMVWRNCDGSTSVEGITRCISQGTGKEIDSRMVWLALDQLDKFELLQTTPEKPVFLAGVNRRQLVKTMGVAAIALPIIFSLTTQPAEAQGSCGTPSGRPLGCPCSNNGQCTSNNCANPAPKQCRP